MRKVVVLLVAMAIVGAACGDGDDAEAGATTATPTEEPTVAPPGPEATTTTSTSAAPEPEIGEIADGIERIRDYPPARYRADQMAPATRFTIEHEWTISDIREEECDCGFSGLRPVDLAAGPADDPFAGIWPVTSWCDITEDMMVVFEPGQLVAAIRADVRLTDIVVAAATVGSFAATRIDAEVVEDYWLDFFWLGSGAPRERGDIRGCVNGNVISPVGKASDHVVFWAVDVDGIDLLINATYPTDLAKEFEPMLESFVESIEFETVPSS